MAYQLNLGTSYRQVHPIFHVSFLKPLVQVMMGICIQQLYISKMSKNGKSVGYFQIKDQVQKGSIWLHIQDMMNLKLVGYQKVNFATL